MEPHFGTNHQILPPFQEPTHYEGWFYKQPCPWSQRSQRSHLDYWNAAQTHEFGLEHSDGTEPKSSSQHLGEFAPGAMTEDREHNPNPRVKYRWALVSGCPPHFPGILHQEVADWKTTEKKPFASLVLCHFYAGKKATVCCLLFHNWSKQRNLVEPLKISLHLQSLQAINSYQVHQAHDESVDHWTAAQLDLWIWWG